MMDISSVDMVEVIDLVDSTLKNEIFRDERSKRSGATGGLINNWPLICGGFKKTDHGPLDLPDCAVL